MNFLTGGHFETQTERDVINQVILDLDKFNIHNLFQYNLLIIISFSSV